MTCLQSSDKTDFLDREIIIAFAPSAESKKCKNLTMPLRRLGEYLATPETGDKDGRGFLMGRLKMDGKRGISEMHDTVLIGFDLDTGHDITDLKQRLRYQGVEAWLYATYSHLTTTSTVKGVAVAQWAKLAKGTAATREHAVAFLRDRKGYAPETLIGAMAEPDGFDFKVWHSPQ